MIDKIVKSLLAVCCICFFTIQSVAHPLPVAGGGSIVMQADTTQHDEEHFSAGNYGFNAMEFAAQGRFRHSDLIRYSNSGIFSHMSVGLTMSLDQIIHQNNYHFSLGTNYGLVLEKDVTVEVVIECAENVKFNYTRLLTSTGANVQMNVNAVLQRESYISLLTTTLP